MRWGAKGQSDMDEKYIRTAWRARLELAVPEHGRRGETNDGEEGSDDSEAHSVWRAKKGQAFGRRFGGEMRAAAQSRRALAFILRLKQVGSSSCSLRRVAGWRRANDLQKGESSRMHGPRKVQGINPRLDGGLEHRSRARSTSLVIRSLTSR